ncbi:MAG: PA0069 family radical SAM protein [Ignavibacteriales bacterium]
MIKEKLKGRGAQLNPKNRFEKLNVEDIPDQENFYDDDFPSENKIPTTYFKDDSKSVIAKNDSQDIGFDYSFNPYRGCEHGCIYCYARPGHEYLSFSSGLDFETKIMVKENAPALLENEFRKKNYRPDLIMFSGNTDCYQPIERKLKITRESLKVCLKYRNPVSVITKNALIQRDIDILKLLAEKNLVKVTLSITTLDKNLARKMEPRTSSPEMRLKTIEVFAKSGIPVGVNIAPIIPGLNDKEIPEILKEASARGAVHAGKIMLRLPYSVKDLFIDWLESEFPEKSKKIINSIKDIRGGKLNSSEWKKRFTGEGKLADSIHRLFHISCRKYGLNKQRNELTAENFLRSSQQQLELFK